MPGTPVGCLITISRLTPLSMATFSMLKLSNPELPSGHTINTEMEYRSIVRMRSKWEMIAWSRVCGSFFFKKEKLIFKKKKNKKPLQSSLLAPIIYPKEVERRKKKEKKF